MRFIDTNEKAASIAMILMGIGFAVLYPKNLWIAQEGWIWDFPGRNFAFERMFVAMYATLGAFMIWGARDPVRYVPLINFTIVSGFLHATVMLIDAMHIPGMHTHLGWRGDVMGTYLAPVVLTIFHPRRRYFRGRSIRQHSPSAS